MLLEVREAERNYDRRQVFRLLLLADDSEQEVRDYMFRGRLFLLLESSTAQVLGQLLLLGQRKRSAEIRNLSVLTEHQCRGFGQFLVKNVLSLLKIEGTTRVRVGTSTADIENIAFYQKLGFRCLRVERDAFTARRGYPIGLRSNGVLVRDKIWFEIYL